MAHDYGRLPPISDLHAREARIYQLQQALAEIPPDSWESHLAGVCPDEADVRAEVLARQAQLIDPHNHRPLAFDFNERVHAEPPTESDFTSWLDALGYDLLGEIGRGGMGVVYKARERRRNHIIALKTLQQRGPASLVRFKQEFRALADVTHPNLASLYEVFSDGSRWFFTMEYVEGVDFLTYVRRGLPGTTSLGQEHLTRLRDALRQLAHALVALHRAGTLHRDVKPSNVLVTKSRRLVLLDFGLAAELSETGVHLNTRTDVAGTAAYMSPEHVAHEPLSPASDWYGLGVMLFEALTSRLPFEGPLFDVLERKVRGEAPSPRAYGADVPADLDDLCVRLLLRSPHARPYGREIVSALDGCIAPDTKPLPEVPLVGRDRPLAELSSAFGVAQAGSPAIAMIVGQSGLGKTTLIQHFLSSLKTVPEPVVFAGRCYEHESVPYKVLDSVMDAVARFLRRLPPAEVDALLPRDVGPLAHVFPCLLTVAAVASSRSATSVQDPQELRRRASAALREFFARLGDRRRVVVVIDDLQWGDVDSVALLRDVLRGPEPPVVLLIGAYRSEDQATSPFLRALAESHDAFAAIDTRHVALTPLSREEARDLAAQLGGRETATAQYFDAIARESAGNPLFVQELVRYLRSRDDGEGIAGAPRRVELEDVIRGRIADLAESQRRLLEIVAVAGRPIDQHVACEAGAAVASDVRTDLRVLSSARLLRASTSSSTRVLVETYHDRIKDTIMQTLDATTLASRHRDLARALEACDQNDPEQLALHHHGAGNLSRAAECYAAAADRATQALAFDRASTLYGLAIAIGDDPRKADLLRTRRADALANAGRGAEAAKEYLHAAQSHPADELELRRRAATQLLLSGWVDEGLRGVNTVLEGLGMQLASTPRRALFSLLTRRCRLRLRGLQFTERRADQIAISELSRVDATWSVALGLSLIDTIRGADFQTLNLLLALEAGEPYRIARALAFEAGHLSAGGHATKQRTEKLLARASALARQAGHPHGCGIVHLSHGFVAYLQARFRDALRHFADAQKTFREECVGVSWELATAQTFELNALTLLGDHASLVRRVPEVLHEAEDRGNLFVLGSLRSMVTPVLRLADDEPLAAREALNTTLSAWSNQGFHVQHANGLLRQAEIELYRGNAEGAASYAEELRKGLAGSHLNRVQLLASSYHFISTHIGLTLAASSTDSERLLRKIERSAQKIAAIPEKYLGSNGHLVLASVAAVRGRSQVAVDRLRIAIAGYDEIGAPVAAAAARRRLAALLPGPEGDSLRRQSDAQFAAQLVKNPARFTALRAPGFSRQLPS